MSGTYAKDTSVTADRSKQEIERTLRRYGATEFMYGWKESGAVIGFRAGRAKLTEQQVWEIRRRYSQEGLTRAALAAQYGITASTVSRILNRKYWRHVFADSFADSAGTKPLVRG